MQPAQHHEHGYVVELPSADFKRIAGKVAPILKVTCSMLRVVSAVASPIAKLAGVEAPTYTQEFGFHDVLQGKATGQPQLFGAYMPNVKVPNGVRAVRQGNYKLLYYTHSGRRQLFNLEKDSWETNDLIGDPKHQEIAEELMAALENWMEKSGDPLGKE